MLPNTGSELKVAFWASWTPEQFILHVCSAIDACKQMELDIKFENTEEAVTMATLVLDVRKEEYVQVRTSERKKNKGNPGEGTPAASKSIVAAKTACDKAKQAEEATKLTVMTEGVKAFELYGNLLSDEARHSWEKNIQARMTTCPWEDVHGVTHEKLLPRPGNPSWNVSCSTYSRCSGTTRARP